MIGRFVYVSIFALSAFVCGRSRAVEITAQKSDTFITEAFPKGEFSNSDFLAVSNSDGERTITYLPFNIRADDVGIFAAKDTISTAAITLFVKSLPSEPKSNAVAENKPAEAKIDTANRKPEDAAEEASEKLSAAANSAKEKAESAQSGEKKVRIEIWGIADMECFEPNSANFRVSWDALHDAPAPKHSPAVQSGFDTDGCWKLGSIEIDPADYDDGDRLEFTSDALADYLNFVYGMSDARNVTPRFMTRLKKIERPAIVLVQTDGPKGVFFYSADSLGEDDDKAESGDEVKAKTEQNKKDFDAVHPKEKADDFIKRFSEIVFAPAFAAIASAVKKLDPETSDNTTEKSEEKKTKETADEAASEAAEKPDLRPHINFEYRRDDDVP